MATLSHLFGIRAFAAGAIVAVRRGSIRPPNLAMTFAAPWVLWSARTYLWSLDRQATLTRAITLAELGRLPHPSPPNPAHAVLRLPASS